MQRTYHCVDPEPTELRMKTTDLQWYDLFHLNGTRRDFLRLSSSVAALLATGCYRGGDEWSLDSVSAYPFTLGVASGDPAPDGMVLWTRLAKEALEGVGALSNPVRAHFEIAHDESFTRLAQTGSTLATPELGHSAHAEIVGLDPDRWYFYRWTVGGEVSTVGRAKTAAAVGASVDELCFAFASCQHYEVGYFTSLEHLSREDVDFAVHLGDYIYEYAEHDRDTVRHHEGPEIVTLDQYRNRYAQYKSDPALQAAHAAMPWIMTFDDHEVDNNWASVFAQDDQSPEQLMLRRASAFQAYYEMMPLRVSTVRNGPNMQIYRRLNFGGLIQMNVLDTRQYRSDQPCSDGRVPTCAKHTSPEQSILGSAQRDWLFEGLAVSDAGWNVMAQQVMVARLRGETDEGDDTWNMDKWDGYPVERGAFLDHLESTAVHNPIVLTGDIHSNWVADLHTDFDDLSSPVVGTEFVGTSLSSGGDGADMTNGGRATLSHNPHIKFYNGQRGYVTATVTPDIWTSEYKVIDKVSEPGGSLSTRATFVVESGSPGVQED